MDYIVRKENFKKACTKEEVNIMPTMEMFECERTAYVKEMEEYLQRLKRMKESEAKKKSFDNLVKSKILHENGEFTEHYEYTKIILQKR